MKAPEELVVTVPGLVVLVDPSNFIVILDVAAKLEPVTVTVTPAGPDVGFNVIEAATLTVKVAEAVLVPSVTLTVCEPDEAPDGTVNVVPVGIAPTEVDVPVQTVVVSNFAVKAVDAAKFDPDRPSDDPAAPDVGFKVIDVGTLALKVAVTVAAPVTVIVVDAEVELANVIAAVGDALHDVNVFEPVGVAEIACADAPESYHVAVDGFVVPAPEGLTANVTWYCVLYVAVNVAAEDGTV